MLEAFATSVELSRAPRALAARVRRHIAQQDELVLSPAYFARAARSSKVADVEALPKRGAHDNELSAYRFDVVIRVGAPAAQRTSPAWTDWEPSLTERRLGAVLAEAGRDRWALRGIANRRVERDVAAWTRLSAGDPGDIESLERELAARSPRGLSLERVIALGEAAGFQVRLSFARCASDGQFDALFEGPAVPALPVSWQWPAEPGRTSNDPALQAERQRLVPLLLAHCEQRLPAGWRLSSISLVDALPEPAPTTRWCRRLLHRPAFQRRRSTSRGPCTPARSAFPTPWRSTSTTRRSATRRCGRACNRWRRG